MIPKGLQAYFCSVAGESFDNDDGSSRQAILRSCRAGDGVTIEHEPHNPYDKYALRVLVDGRGQVGHIPRDQNRDLLRRSSLGWRYRAALAAVTGGTFEKPHRGATLYVVETDPDTPDGVSDAFWPGALAEAIKDCAARAR